MPEESRDCGCGRNNNCLSNLFGGCGCGDSSILFFIIGGVVVLGLQKLKSILEK